MQWRVPIKRYHSIPSLVHRPPSSFRWKAGHPGYGSEDITAEAILPGHYT